MWAGLFLERVHGKVSSCHGQILHKYDCPKLCTPEISHLRSPHIRAVTSNTRSHQSLHIKNHSRPSHITSNARRHRLTSHGGFHITCGISHQSPLCSRFTMCCWSRRAAGLAAHIKYHTSLHPSHFIPTHIWHRQNLQNTFCTPKPRMDLENCCNCCNLVCKLWNMSSCCL